MPQPMPFHEDGTTNGSTGPAWLTEPTTPRHATRPTPAPRSPDQDSSGRPLALRLPDWDLLPPTEFLNRHPGR